MYLIEKTDLKNNKSEIVGNTPILKSDASNYFNKIFEKIQMDNQNKLLKMTLDQSNYSCQIFIEEEIVNKGWVWNSTNIHKNVIFKLSLIELNETFLETTIVNNNENFNYGYASHCFSPDWKVSFVNELKYKLSLPKYGLESTF